MGSEPEPEHQAMDSDCKAFAAFGTACIDDGTAANSLHARAKAMCALAANYGRLIGAFHCGCPEREEVFDFKKAAN
jgi:hypothetical protein